MERVILANLPTPIIKLERLSEKTGHQIWMKRDDYTGVEVSGNKVRKLEYSVAEALSQEANHLITCGGIQSNHARATGMVAKRLGLGVSLVLRGEASSSHEGNPFLSRMAGADLHFITELDYRERRGEVMEAIAKDLARDGVKAYIIPEGASHGIGSFGYARAYEEILSQEKALGFRFDRIVVAVGSGGTFAGLNYGNLKEGKELRVTGINICDDAAFFKEVTKKLISEMNTYAKTDYQVTEEDLSIIDGYPGLGYAISRREELETIKKLAELEGVLLDPVYTGKAMHGLVQEIQKRHIEEGEKILFIHTGGIFGWTAEKISQMENL